MRRGTLVKIEPTGHVSVELEPAAIAGALCLLSTSVLPLRARDLGAKLVLWVSSDEPGIIMGRELPARDEPDASPVEALVDGQRVVLDASQEIVLRCGDASITLRRNGRIVLKGVHIETSASGTNRIKGGSVKIN